MDYVSLDDKGNYCSSVSPMKITSSQFHEYSVLSKAFRQFPSILIIKCGKQHKCYLYCIDTYPFSLLSSTF